MWKNKVSLKHIFWEIWVKSLVTSSEVFVWHCCHGCQSQHHHQVKGYSWLLHSECGFCSHLPPSGCTRVLKKRLPSPLSCFCTMEHQEATAVKNPKSYVYFFSPFLCLFCQTWTSLQNLYWSVPSSETPEPQTLLRSSASSFLWYPLLKSTIKYLIIIPR